MKQEFQHCQNRIVKSRKRDSMYCWSCNHYALTQNNKCNCCFGIVTRPKKHERMLEIKTEIENLLQDLENKEEYRFYINGWVCWIKKSDLDQYQKLSGVEKHDRYYHFLKSLVENDRLSRVIH